MCKNENLANVQIAEPIIKFPEIKKIIFIFNAEEFAHLPIC
jgi:hypothetical protein